MRVVKREEVVGLHPWRYSKPNWTQPALGDSSSEQGFGQSPELLCSLSSFVIT